MAILLSANSRLCPQIHHPNNSIGKPVLYIPLKKKSRDANTRQLNTIFLSNVKIILPKTSSTTVSALF